MYFGAGTAGAGIAHGPEVICLTEPGDAVFRHPDIFMPDFSGFIVVQIDGYPEFVFIKTVPVGQQVPAEFNGLLLEIIPEREIAQHLKECMVSGCVSHVLQVIVFAAGPDTFLGRGGPDIAAFFFTEEGPLELNHTGIGKQQGRIIGWHEG